MRGTIYTLHYISSKGAMKCVWDIVSVHVSLHGISDCRCRYKVSANELCQRQLKTWWNGQWGDEKLALCSLGRCCIATPDSFGTLWLTCASRPKTEKKRKKERNPGLCCIISAILEAMWSASALLSLFKSVPNRIPMYQTRYGAWHKVILVLPFPRAVTLCRPHFTFPKRGLQVYSGLLSVGKPMRGESFCFISYLSSLTICYCLIE